MTRGRDDHGDTAAHGHPVHRGGTPTAGYDAAGAGEPDPAGAGRHEEAFEVLDEGIGRRDLLRAAAAVGTGAVAPAWLLSPGATEAMAAPRGERGPAVLNSDAGRKLGRFVPSRVEEIRWGYLPNARAKQVASVRSGGLVTFDTVSHEGILEDQGRDAVAYFAKHGVAESKVLTDARAIAESSLTHDFDRDGPHIVTGPVSVIGAVPGDVLKIDVIGLVPRASYGVISSRHGKGALPGEYPQNPGPQPGRSAARPELYNNVSVFTPIRRIGDGLKGILPVTARQSVEFPIDPFMGIMGVALPTSEPVNSIPPTVAGGNIDIKNLTVGSTLYLPVFVPEAKFFVGDPHYVQGNGEVALTALEAPLRGTFRLTVLKAGSAAIPGKRGGLPLPFAENGEYWMPVGLNVDLDEAMKQAVRESIAFLHGELGMSRAIAYAYLSAASDYVVSQVVDRTKGVHALIRKSDFPTASY